VEAGSQDAYGNFVPNRRTRELEELEEALRRELGRRERMLP
jgi:hypothetical protein